MNVRQVLGVCLAIAVMFVCGTGFSALAQERYAALQEDSGTTPEASSDTTANTSLNDGTTDAGSLTTEPISTTEDEGPKFNVSVLRRFNGNVSADTKSGSVQVSAKTAAPGKIIRLTATPAKGYRFVGWEVEEGRVEISDNRFLMPDRDVVIWANFESSDGLKILGVQTDFTPNLWNYILLFAGFGWIWMPLVTLY